MKRKLISPIIKLGLIGSLLAISVVYGGTTLAWFSQGDYVKYMGFQILRIDSIVHLYKANDTNFNGIPDKLTTVGQYFYNSVACDYSEGYCPDGRFGGYKSTYYTEDLEFNWIDSESALSEDSTYNMMSPVTVENLYPSQIVTFKYVLINNSDADNLIGFYFDEKAEGDYSQIKARVGSVDVDENDVKSVNFGEWTSLSNEKTQIEFAENLIVHYSGVNVHDVWLQIKLDENADNSSTNKTIELPNCRLQFQVTEAE